ncbi:acyl carrier protein [Actinomadura sp. WMMA1423]|uniref:acyl carrier protein n=1 Tax=Actinomadura sp. WMMA1423 TaxID=2591108 RepID=UPI00114735DF|nr:acyl carrier protein [Actinomadura sp. WMMA1423]
MASGEFTITDLRRILYEAAGESEGVDLDATALDSDFVELGYESLALLETGSRIEREFGIELDEAALFETSTPRTLIEAVNARLSVPESA